MNTRHLCQVPWRWSFDHGQGTDLRHSTNALGLTLPRHSCCGQIR